MEKTYKTPQSPANTTEDERLSFPASIGKGYIQNVYFKSGIQLCIADYTLQRPIIRNSDSPLKSIGFGFQLSGCELRYPTGQKTDKIIEPQTSKTVKTGRANFLYYPDVEGLTVHMGTERVVRAGVFMDFTQFCTFAQEETQALVFQRRNPSTGAFSHKGQITPAMRAAIFQIFNCPYQGWAKNLFLESKALELMAHKIGQIETDATRKPDANPLPPQDEERILEAARLLTGDLETSPDLNQLAQSVGMCRSKLHRCFQMFYGVTPFEYLRNRRLETAMDYLMDGRMSVTEAAFAVGYSCPSYFTKVFKKYFGHLPSKNSIK